MNRRRAAVAAGLCALVLATGAHAQAKVDHLMLGAPDLAAGSRAVEGWLGAAPGAGGVHPGRGTANTLLSLGGRVYLEVIAPDPGQSVTGGRVGPLKALKAPALQTFAAASSDIDGLAAKARAAGLTASGPLPGSRRTPDGRLLTWRTLEIGGHPFGDFVPFFIDWGDTPHPSATSPGGASLKRFVVVHPQAAELRRIYRALGLEVEVAAGAQPMMIAEVSGPAGDAVLVGP